MGNSILDHRWIDTSSPLDAADAVATADPNQPIGILTMDELILALCIMAAITPDQSDEYVRTDLSDQTDVSNIDESS